MTAPISTGNIGAIGELVVAADLMRKGLHVFRAVGPNGPFDLVVLCGGRLVGVEVKTASRYPSGIMSVPVLRSEIFRTDAFALWIRDEGAIVYVPDISLWPTTRVTPELLAAVLKCKRPPTWLSADAA